MPASPLTVNVSGNGAGAALPVSNATLILGTCSSGTDNEIVSLGSLPAVVTEFGSGPLVQLAGMYLQITNRPVYLMRINDSVAATMSAVAYTRISTSTGTVANNSSTPRDAFDVMIVVTKTGTVGTAEFKYSLDGGIHFSGILVSAASTTLGSSGINLTLADGGGPTTGFVAGDIVTFTTTAPGFVAADLTAALTAFQNTNTRVRRIHPAGTTASMYADIRTAMNNMENAYKWNLIILESDDRGAGPESVAAWQSGVLTDYATDDDRCHVIAGWQEITMPAKYGDMVCQLRRPSAWLVGPREASIDISEDPGWVQRGGLQGAILDTISASNPTGLDIDGALYTAFEGRGITTVQTYKMRPGEIYCGGGFMRVQPNNSFYRVANRQVMDAICEIVADIALNYVNADLQANEDGTIKSQNADAIDSLMNAAIVAQFVKTNPPRISESSSGNYATVDRTTDIVTTETLTINISVNRKAFIGNVVLNLSYAVVQPSAVAV